MNEIFCQKCRRAVKRLETYIRVGDVILCDECYMNMSTKEFLQKIGGCLCIKD